MAHGPVILEMKDVHVNYGPVPAVRGISLSIREGEIVALIGANGAGKTTTLKAISGVCPVARGEVLYCGGSLKSRPPEDTVRLGIALVPEGRLLFPTMSVWDNLALGAYHRHRSRERNNIEQDLEMVFQLFPVLKNRLRQPAGTLSGGEQQMVAIGRGLMVHPRLLLMDEPSLGLAPLLVREVMQVVARLRERGMTVLLVEQNARAALNIADHAHVMEKGQVVLSGPAQELACDSRVVSAYLGRRGQ
jgi:branched-chain amino acid transport system ATP-binding protein